MAAKPGPREPLDWKKPWHVMRLRMSDALLLESRRENDESLADVIHRMIVSTPIESEEMHDEW